MTKSFATAAAALAMIAYGTAYGTTIGDGEHATASTTAINEAASSPGEAVFDRWCLECHGVGDRYPGTVSLAVKYGDRVPAALEEREDLTPELIALFTRQGVSMMPPFRKTEISDEELAALGAYLSRREEPAITAPDQQGETD